MLNRFRAAWRSARSNRILRRPLEAADRIWWARTIRRGRLVDPELVAAQGHRGSTRSAVRRYVRGGFRTGFTLNPLLMERLVASQLSDVGRVPALYAYLVNDTRRLETSVSWHPPEVAETIDSASGPGGALGAAWRSARTSGTVLLDDRSTPWAAVSATAALASRHATRAAPDPELQDVGGDVVLVCRIDEREDAFEELRLSVASARRGASVVIALSGRSADLWVNASLLTLWLPGVQVVRDCPQLIDSVRARAPQAVIVVRGPRAVITDADVQALAAAATDRVVMPLWLDLSSGTVVSAGVGSRSGNAFDLLAGHPAEDAHSLGPHVETIGLRGGTYAIPPVSNADPIVLTTAVVRAPAEVPPSSPSGSRRTDTDLDTLLRPAGLATQSWSSSGARLRRLPRSVTLDDDREVPSLRWAIKIAAPPGARGEWWGDTHFARGIAQALRRLGQEVVIDAYEARSRSSAYLDDVVLALRGPEPIEPQPGARSLLWVISHPDEIDPSDLDGFDAVFAASAPWADRMSQRSGRRVEQLLQCTDSHRFRPHGLERTGGLVFVGTARGIARPSIIEPLRAGIPVSVYGPDWSGWIPGAAIKASGLPNEQLPALYESAAAVLNDHWPAMQREGFISNRLFDVVAAGGRAVSDDVTGIAEAFGGAVLTYDGIPGLIDLLTGDLDERFPPDSELAEISEVVRHRDSFDARARTLLDVAVAL